MKKAISLGVAAAMAATLLAGCGTAASSAAASSEAASTADSATAESTAASEAAPSEAHEINTTDPIELTISWWGGDSRHEAYQKALEAFHEKYPNITVSPTYGAWSGWEEKQSTALAADQGSDVMQVNWNWLYQYSPTGEKFVDLREYSDYRPEPVERYRQERLHRCRQPAGSAHLDDRPYLLLEHEHLQAGRHRGGSHLL